MKQRIDIFPDFQLKQFSLILFFCVLGEPHNPFPNYRYTGDLKAVYPLSPRREVPEGIMRRKYFIRHTSLSCILTLFIYLADYAETSIPVSEEKARRSPTIKVCNEEEIEGMRKVCKVSRFHFFIFIVFLSNLKYNRSLVKFQMQVLPQFVLVLLLTSLVKMLKIVNYRKQLY